MSSLELLQKVELNEKDLYSVQILRWITVVAEVYTLLNHLKLKYKTWNKILKRKLYTLIDINVINEKNLCDSS